MRRLASALALAALIAAPSTASAQLSLMPKIGTPGLGVDLAVRPHSWVVVRAGGAIIPYEPGFTVAEIDWEVEMPANGLGAVDLHLGGTGFRISGGAFYLTDDVLFRGDFTGEVEVGDETWTREEVGQLQASMVYDDLSPFLSVGYGHAAGTGAGIFLELGGAFIGEPGVELTSEGGTESDNPDFQAAMESQERDLEDDLSDASIYPILNIGVRIGF